MLEQAHVLKLKLLSTIKAPLSDEDTWVRFDQARFYWHRPDFFPTASGLTDDADGPITTIVLGSDWGNYSSYCKWMKLPKADRGHTMTAISHPPARWHRHKEMLFHERVAGPATWQGNSMGRHPLREDQKLLSVCRDFFAVTLDTFRPKLVITLGLAPAWFVAPFCEPGWEFGSIKRCRDLRIKGSPSALKVQKALGFDERKLQAHGGIVNAHLTHPSRQSNSKHRTLAPFADETALLKKAKRLASL